jgi:chromosomal replication initiation ATPase DnaA
MQTSLEFETKNLITAAFLGFAERKYFNFFLSFARSQNSFLRLNLSKENFEKITDNLGKFKYFEKNKADGYLEVNLDDLIFINLKSFLTGRLEDELLFLDIFRTLQGKDQTFIGLSYSSFVPKFALPDVKSRFDASIVMDFENETNFDFTKIGVDFMMQNGIKIEPSVLDFMLKNVERDIPSLTIFISELKKFVEINKKKVTKNNFEEIFKNYEKARGKADF